MFNFNAWQNANNIGNAGGGGYENPFDFSNAPPAGNRDPREGAAPAMASVPIVNMTGASQMGMPPAPTAFGGSPYDLGGKASQPAQNPYDMGAKMSQPNYPNFQGGMGFGAAGGAADMGRDKLYWNK